MDRIAEDADSNRCIVTLLALALTGLAGLFLWTGIAEGNWWLLDFLGQRQKAETLTFLGLAMGGVVLAIQAAVAYRRARALEETARAQADAVAQTEKGQRQERLKNAIEHLGHGSPSVRIAGVMELVRLAEDAPELKEIALGTWTGTTKRPRATWRTNMATSIQRSRAEIQALLDIVTRDNHETFKGRPVKLRKRRLDGMDLWGAHLENADLRGTRFVEADLREADLRGADLRDADFRGADLRGANLSGADLRGANLDGAAMEGADLAGALTEGGWPARRG